jgi:hypothetical protein
MALYAEHDNLTANCATLRNGLPSHLVHHKLEDEIRRLTLNKREKSIFQVGPISSCQLFIRLGTFGVRGYVSSENLVFNGEEGIKVQDRLGASCLLMRLPKDHRRL